MTTDSADVAARTVRFGPAGAIALDQYRFELQVETGELRAELWGNQHLEWRNSLHQCVRDLRRALSDDVRQPRFVATVPRRGYRFVGERMPTEAQVSRFGWMVRAFGRTSLAFAAGVATAVLMPAVLSVLCVVLAGGAPP